MTTVGGNMLAVAQAQFGLRLLATLVADAPGENVIVSPLGLFQALSLYAFLLDGTDRQDVRKALHIANLSDKHLQEMYARQGERLQMTSCDTELSCATSFWTGDAIRVAPSFLDLAHKWGVTVRSGADVTDAKMHTWAQEQTRGLLSPSLPAPTGMQANLTNAVYFRGTWDEKFREKDTKDRPFYRIGGLPKNSPLMRRPEAGRVKLYHGDAFDAARIPYKSDVNHELTLHVILPKRNALDRLMGKDYLTPWVQQFTLNDWDRCQSGYEDDANVLVDLILPRFTFRQTHDLRKALMQMGFGKILKVPASPNKNGLPVVEKAQQQVYVAVNEGGTEAAALTEFTKIATASLYPEEPSQPRIEKFYTNRPFLFFLTEELSGQMLFAGVIRDPATG